MRIRWKGYAVVFYTNRIIPKRFDGYAMGPFIIIRPHLYFTSNPDNLGLLEHELCHARQWWRNPVRHMLVSLIRSKWKVAWCEQYKLDCEVEAYSIQLRYSPDDVKTFARFIATKYGLDITEQEALTLLRLETIGG